MKSTLNFSRIYLETFPIISLKICPFFNPSAPGEQFHDKIFNSSYTKFAKTLTSHYGHLKSDCKKDSPLIKQNAVNISNTCLPPEIHWLFSPDQKLPFPPMCLVLPPQLSLWPLDHLHHQHRSPSVILQYCLPTTTISHPTPDQKFKSPPPVSSITPHWQYRI
jgi:hypothetical protein